MVVTILIFNSHLQYAYDGSSIIINICYNFVNEEEIVYALYVIVKSRQVIQRPIVTS